MGEILGNFFDVHGKPVHSHLDDQSIGLRLQDLQRISTVVAVASEPDKLDAITGALRTGAVNVLVTSSDNALGLLDFVGVTDRR